MSSEILKPNSSEQPNLSEEEKITIQKKLSFYIDEFKRINPLFEKAIAKRDKNKTLIHLRNSLYHKKQKSTWILKNWEKINNNRNIFDDLIENLENLEKKSDINIYNSAEVLFDPKYKKGEIVNVISRSKNNQILGSFTAKICDFIPWNSVYSGIKNNNFIPLYQVEVVSQPATNLLPLNLHVGEVLYDFTREDDIMRL